MITQRMIDRKLRKVIKLRSKRTELNQQIQTAEEEYAEAILQRRNERKRR